MSYYEQFKPEIDERIQGFKTTFESLNSQLEKILKRLKDETYNRKNLEEQIQRLKDLSGESLSGETGSYEKFKTSMKKLNEQLKVSTDMVETLESEIVPNTERQLIEAKGKLERAVSDFLLSKKPDFEKRLAELFQRLSDEQKDFLDSAKRLFTENGVLPKLRRLAVNMKVGKYRLRVSESLIEIALLPPSNWPVKQPHLGLTPETPQDVAEGNLIPSEAGSQAVEPETPCNEPVETPSDNTFSSYAGLGGGGETAPSVPSAGRE